MKTKLLTKAFAMILAVIMVIGMLPMSALAVLDYNQDALEDDYYKLISKKDWELAPGVQETEIVLNNAEGSQRQVVHSVKVDMNNPYTKVIPGYKGMIPTEGNYGTEATSTQAKNAEALGYGNVVAATNAMLSWYNSAYYTENPHLIGEPLYYNIIDGYYYENSQGAASFSSKNGVVVINYDYHPISGEKRPDDMPKVLMRSQTDPLTGWEENAICVWEFLVKPDENGNPKPTYSKNHTSGFESRTFVGITAEGEIILSVADGRQSPYSAGFNYYEMGEYMIKMGCIYAANCDGGGSTTFVSERPGEELKVNCSLSDGGERPTTNTFLVISTAPASGTFERATITTEYDYYTPGSSVTFSALGTDAVGTKVDIPDDVEWVIKEEGMGTIENGVFYSNGTAGTVTAQMIYDGKVVGERTVTLAMPDALSFSQPVVTIPVGAKAQIPVKATLNGLYEIGISPDDVIITSENAQLGAVDGLHFVGAAEVPEENSSALTVTLKSDPSITASTTLQLGEASVVMWDFEGGQEDIDEWNCIVLRNPGEAHRDFYHKLSLATAEDGQVHDGEYSMRLETNGLSSADVHSKQYAYVRLGLKDQKISLENARSLGFWLYVPEDNIQCWVQGYYKYDTNGDGVPDTLAEVNLMNSENVYYNVDESGWHYLSMDLSDFETVDLTYSSPFDADPSDGTAGDTDEFFLTIIFHKSINNILWQTNGSINGPFTYYIDNITVDYSEAVEDREAPIFESVVLESNGEKKSLSKHDVGKITSNILNVTANVAEATYRTDGTGTKHTLYNYTGLNEASAKAYIDGVEVGCTFGNGKIAISGVAVADGYHRVKFEIYDNAGNKSTVVRMVNVESGVKASTVQLVAADPSLVAKDRLDFGSLFWMNLTASNIETIQSVSTVIDLNNVNHWELDHMVVADGFSASYWIDNETNTATITFTRTGTNYQVGEAVLAQLPIRIIYFDTDMNIPGYTAETVWTKYQFWPHDLKVDVDKGLITYVDGYSSSVLNTFSNEKFQVNTEMYTDYQSMGSDPYYTEHGTTHVHTPVALEDKAAGCTDGYIGRTFCEGCNSIVDWGTTLPATGVHSYEVVDGKLTCTAGGELFSGVYTDGKTYVEGVVIADGWLGEHYYVDGEKLVGVHIIDGKYYEFDQDGICANNMPMSLWYTNEAGESFYLDAGVPMTQYTMINTVPTFFYDNGVAYQGEIEINGEICVFEQGAFVESTTADILLAGRCGPKANFVLYTDGTFVLCGEGETWDFVSVGKTYLPNLSWKNRPWGNQHNPVAKSIKKVIVGKDITVIGDRFLQQCYNLEEIVFEEGSALHTLSTFAFHYALKLKEIELPSCLKTIEYSALGYCDSLLSVKMPQYVSSMDSRTFWNNSANMVLNVVEGSYAARFAEKNGILMETRASEYGPTDVLPGDRVAESGTCGENAIWTLYQSGKMVISGSGAVESYTNFNKTPWYDIKTKIEAIKIGKDITQIGANAFAHLYNLKYIEFEEGSQLHTLEHHAFHYAYKVESVVLPKNLTSVGYTAFGYMDKLSYVWIPDGLLNIDANTFLNNTPANITLAVAEGSIGYTFATTNGFNTELRESVPVLAASGTCGENLTWELYSNGILYINGEGMMPDYNYSKYDSDAAPWVMYREQIKKIVIGAGVENIGSFAFYQCTNLAEVVFEENCKLSFIATGSFGYTTVLKSITIPASVETIDAHAFYYSGLETVAFEKDGKLNAINDYAFRNCTSLTSIYIPDGVTAIGSGIFYACGKQFTLNVAEGSYAHSYALSKGYSVMTREPILSVKYAGACGEGLTWELYSNGDLYINGEGMMPDYNYSKYNANAAPWAMYREQIKKVIIGAGVENIGSFAFYQCTNLAEVIFEENSKLSFIATGSFGYTTALKSITIPASVETIDMCGLYYSGLETVAFEENSKLRFIKDYAFRNCIALQSIYIPSSVTYIGSSILYACGDQVIVSAAEGTCAYYYALYKGYEVVVR